jgi:putative oxidoreductase
MNVTSVLGRAIFGGFFLYNGINHLRHTEPMAQYARAKGVPQANFMVKATGVALIAGGASVLLGVKPRWGAIPIAAFLAGVSPIMHDFWRQQDPGQRQNDLINFAKNVALLGATLELMGDKEPSRDRSSMPGAATHYDWRSAAQEVA